MTEKLFPMQLGDIPHSSVVGRGLVITSPKHGVVAQLAIMVPSPRFDYKVVSAAIVKALMNGHFSSEGRVTLVLPEDFANQQNTKGD